jgi:hypothetical protein
MRGDLEAGLASDSHTIPHAAAPWTPLVTVTENVVDHDTSEKMETFHMENDSSVNVADQIAPIVSWPALGLTTPRKGNSIRYQLI